MDYEYQSSPPAWWDAFLSSYHYEYIPPPSEAAFSEALDQLTTYKSDDRIQFSELLSAIALKYWQARDEVERPRPPVKLYRDYTERLRKAFLVVSQVIKKLPEPSDLDNIIQIEMNRPLKKGAGGWEATKSVSIEELLDQAAQVFERKIQQRGKSGRSKAWHIIIAARDTIELWQGASGKRMGLSLDTEIEKHWTHSRSKEVFTYPGPRFVQTVLQGIDSTLDVGKIQTALRNLLGGKSEGKPWGVSRGSRISENCESNNSKYYIFIRVHLTRPCVKICCTKNGQDPTVES
jgi:hypothetical protein